MMYNILIKPYLVRGDDSIKKFILQWLQFSKKHIQTRIVFLHLIKAKISIVQKPYVVHNNSIKYYEQMIIHYQKIFRSSYCPKSYFPNSANTLL